MWVEAEQDGDFEEPVPAWKHFGFDMVGTAGWFDIMPLIDFEELVDETDEWEIKRNGAGAALKYWKHKSGTPEHVDFLMTNREIWEQHYTYSHFHLEAAAFECKDSGEIEQYLKQSLKKDKSGGFRFSSGEIAKRTFAWLPAGADSPFALHRAHQKIIEAMP